MSAPEDSASTTVARRRRSMLTAAVAAAAALAGGGIAWRQLQRPGDSDAQSQAVEALWSLRFDKPGGGAMTMASFRGRPLLLNFWATWCPPCVEELPLLDRFYRERAANGWQVVGLAIDQPSSVRNFLGRTPVSFPIGLAGLEGTELGKSLGNLSGGLPFTVVFSPEGTVRQRRMGRITEADLAQWAAAA